MQKIDTIKITNNLLKKLKEYKEKNITIDEISDFANEIGLLIGKELNDNESQAFNEPQAFNEFLYEFLYGFRHGLDLSRS